MSHLIRVSSAMYFRKILLQGKLLLGKLKDFQSVFAEYAAFAETVSVLKIFFT